VPITIDETIIPPPEATKEVPRRRRGRKTHVSTIYRWMTSGCRGIVLESIQVGGTRCTSREALQRFFDRLSESAPTGSSEDHSGPISVRRSLAQRQRQSAEAGRRLAEMGA
jgi:hypothetical protein